MQPNFTINFYAILSCIIASFVIGIVWYGPLFGKVWARLNGLPPQGPTEKSFMVKALALNIIGNFLTAYVLAHSANVWRASVWNVGPDLPDWTYGLYAALLTWLGFYIPMGLGSIAWERKPWKLFWINQTYQLVNLLVICMILVHWR